MSFISIWVKVQQIGVNRHNMTRDVYLAVKQLQNKTKQKSGLDLGFLERGFKFTKGGLIC